ncbi:hypothetical protein GALMADRAFT_68512 [Galerina marginata CBS 339.88]|uniref:BTB domain-containing protein n=1 Tax=Galerina marginata (strain CBS 339.88) TaxID=685588 RepID=A0A067SX83_GALM3|nr:hypothetical protein GALMADRAFT_68512 [Galerina marginata CBS 339.88]
MANQNQAKSSKIIHDKDFYLQIAVFLVEDTLFKLPILDFTEESEVFKTMFQLPQNPHVEVEGMTDEKPIVLEGVKKEDFKQLLRIVYSRRHRKEEKLTTKEWESVLVLSSKWDMDVLRQLAIRKITPDLVTDPHELVLWGQKYNVDSWTLEGIRALVDQEEPMHEEDVKTLGLSVILKISAIREWLAWKAFKNAGYSRQVQHIKATLREELEGEIATVFGLNLDGETEDNE